MRSQKAREMKKKIDIYTVFINDIMIISNKMKVSISVCISKSLNREKGPGNILIKHWLLLSR